MRPRGSATSDEPQIPVEEVKASNIKLPSKTPSALKIQSKDNIRYSNLSMNKSGLNLSEYDHNENFSVTHLPTDYSIDEEGSGLKIESPPHESFLQGAI